ncbi:hypothetical protein DAI22_09g037400 [Oryza sativa Japonica Group]|nr:hypothetical protein DAI22_09g037400 [Oryza sativa Japonica Group]
MKVSRFNVCNPCQQKNICRAPQLTTFKACPNSSLVSALEGEERRDICSTSSLLGE